MLKPFLGAGLLVASWAAISNAHTPRAEHTTTLTGHCVGMLQMGLVPGPAPALQDLKCTSLMIAAQDNGAALIKIVTNLGDLYLTGNLERQTDEAGHPHDLLQISGMAVPPDAIGETKEDAGCEIHRINAGIIAAVECRAALLGGNGIGAIVRLMFTADPEA